jgi:hypothetical protein
MVIADHLQQQFTIISIAVQQRLQFLHPRPLLQALHVCFVSAVLPAIPSPCVQTNCSKWPRP